MANQVQPLPLLTILPTDEGEPSLSAALPKYGNSQKEKVPYDYSKSAGQTDRFAAIGTVPNLAAGRSRYSGKYRHSSLLPLHPKNLFF